MINTVQTSTCYEVLLIFQLPRYTARMQQVKHIASDSPSARMHEVLSSVCPQLESLELDTCHLVMVYEAAQWGKRSEGSAWLRKIMNKFAVLDPSCDGPVTVVNDYDMFYRCVCKRLEYW